jgi:DNA-binding NtrC family response regulator
MKINYTSPIFIVDDDPFWTALLKQLLKGLGYNNISSFINGADCIRNLHVNPAVIFLDYEMKEMNGLEVLQKVMLYNDCMNVVFCSDQREINIAVEAMKKGSFDYLKKSSTMHSDVELVMQKLAALKPPTEKIY